jgi:hypothetical protein
MISQQYQSRELSDSNPGEKTGREAVRKGGGNLIPEEFLERK